MTRRTDRSAPQPSGDFLTDPEAARLLNLGTTKLAELQKLDPTFPRPVWLGERAKRHVRGELVAWALNKRKQRGSINGGGAK